MARAPTHLPLHRPRPVRLLPAPSPPLKRNHRPHFRGRPTTASDIPASITNGRQATRPNARAEQFCHAPSSLIDTQSRAWLRMRSSRAPAACIAPIDSAGCTRKRIRSLSKPCMELRQLHPFSPPSERSVALARPRLTMQASIWLDHSLPSPSTAQARNAALMTPPLPSASILGAVIRPIVPMTIVDPCSSMHVLLPRAPPTMLSSVAGRKASTPRGKTLSNRFAM